MKLQVKILQGDYADFWQEDEEFTKAFHPHLGTFKGQIIDGITSWEPI